MLSILSDCICVKHGQSLKWGEVKLCVLVYVSKAGSESVRDSKLFRDSCRIHRAFSMVSSDFGHFCKFKQNKYLLQGEKCRVGMDQSLLLIHLLSFQPRHWSASSQSSIKELFHPGCGACRRSPAEPSRRIAPQKWSSSKRCQRGGAWQAVSKVRFAQLTEEGYQAYQVLGRKCLVGIDELIRSLLNLWLVRI